MHCTSGLSRGLQPATIRFLFHLKSNGRCRRAKHTQTGFTPRHQHARLAAIASRLGAAPKSLRCTWRGQRLHRAAQRADTFIKCNFKNKTLLVACDVGDGAAPAPTPHTHSKTRTVHGIFICAAKRSSKSLKAASPDARQASRFAFVLQSTKKNHSATRAMRAHRTARLLACRTVYLMFWLLFARPPHPCFFVVRIVCTAYQPANNPRSL